MPRAHRDGVLLYYEVEGSGETVVCVGEMGFGAWQWGWQHAALSCPYEVLAYDHRGTGRSDTPPGPYSVEMIAADLDSILADYGVRGVHLIGAGLGGMVALQYAREYGRARTLVLIGTSVGGSHSRLPAAPRKRLFAPSDDPAALRISTAALFSHAFVAEHSDVIERITEWRATDDADRKGWDAQNAAFGGFDASDWLYEITIPTLVLHGEDDEIAPVENGRTLVENLPKADLETYEKSDHGVWIERSQPVNDRISGFLDEHSD
jgi:3-oxoadipate enol-lactonase